MRLNVLVLLFVLVATMPFVSADYLLTSMSRDFSTVNGVAQGTWHYNANFNNGTKVLMQYDSTNTRWFSETNNDGYITNRTTTFGAIPCCTTIFYPATAAGGHANNHNASANWTANYTGSMKIEGWGAKGTLNTNNFTMVIKQNGVLIASIFVNTSSNFTYEVGATVTAGDNISMTVEPKNANQSPHANVTMNLWNNVTVAQVAAPNVTLLDPVDKADNRSAVVAFTFRAYSTGVIRNATLYGNWTGVWAANATNATNVLNNTNFTFFIGGLPKNGYYVWNVLVWDNNTNSSFGLANFSINYVDNVPVVTLLDPPTGVNNLSAEVAFTIRGTDDIRIQNATFFSNVSGTWAANGTNTSNVLNNTNFTFFRGGFPINSLYVWNVRYCDSLGQCSFAPTNFSFTNNNPAPVVTINGTLNYSLAADSSRDYDAIQHNTVGGWHYMAVSEDAVFISSYPSLLLTYCAASGASFDFWVINCGLGEGLITNKTTDFNASNGNWLVTDNSNQPGLVYNTSMNWTANATGSYDLVGWFIRTPMVDGTAPVNVTFYKNTAAYASYLVSNTTNMSFNFSALNVVLGDNLSVVFGSDVPTNHSYAQFRLQYFYNTNNNNGSPQNATYFSNSIPLIFSVTDDSSNPLTCYRVLDGASTIIGSVPNATSNTTTMSGLSAGQHSVLVRCSDSSPLNGSSATVYFTVADYAITSTTYNAVEYETASAPFNTTVNITSGLISDVNASLFWNGVEYATGATKAVTTAGFTQLFAFNQTVDVPLIAVNNSIRNHVWQYSIRYANGTLLIVNGSTNAQNITWAYFVSSLAVQSVNASEGQPFTVNTSIANFTGRASTSVVSQYNLTSGAASIFSTNLYRATVNVPAILNDNATALVFSNLTVSFLGASQVRNSSTTSVTTFRIVITNCSNLSTTQTLNFSLFDEFNGSAVNNGTVNLNGFFSYPGGSVTRAYNFSYNLTNTNSGAICIYPSWAVYSSQVSISYSAPTYTQRFSFFFGNLSNTTTYLSLYLGGTSNLSEVDYVVKDWGGNPQVSLVVRAYRYVTATNSFLLVAQGLTDVDGKGKVFLDATADYYKFVIVDSFNNEILNESPIILNTQRLIAANVYLIDFTVGQPVFPVYEEFGNLVGACVFNNVTTYMNCSLNDATNASSSVSLVIEQLNALGFTPVCSNVTSSSSSSISCNVTNYNNTVLKFALKGVNSDGTSYLIDSGILDFTGKIANWYNSGYLLTIFIVLTFALIGAWNPSVMLFLSGFGLILAYLIGAFYVGAGVLVTFLLAIALIVYKSRS